MNTHSINPALAPSLLAASPSAPTRAPARAAFADQLADAKRAVTFSGHASDRLAQRGVTLDASQMRRLEHSVTQAAGKGSRSALVLVDRVAMIVAVPERTVVTAMPTDQGLFTNIDAAVVA